MVGKIFAATITLIFIGTSSAYALSGNDFKAGKIIDNTVFFNSQALSTSDVQGFLYSKVPSCDTNGAKMYNSTQTRAEVGASKGYRAPYTCLKDYSQDTPSKSDTSGLCSNYVGGLKSAAQIIVDISKACGVSSKVLLVLLQKEQSLVSDDWPWSIQYRSATGYGCPDTAPCDAEYYGFFNQVYNSAKQFRNYDLNQASFRYRAGRNNFIQYNPNTACGGSNVYIENQATAGLYNYTPYQPNSSGLNNLYGSGDACSAYGNRNFWRLFNDWFGSTNYSYGPVPSAQSFYAKAPCAVPDFNNTVVGRLYNPDVKDYFYTSSHDEACKFITQGYIWDEVMFDNASSDLTAIPVYRIANYERHIFTTDKALRDSSVANYGYRDEGVGFYAFSTIDTNRVPISALQSGDSYVITPSGKEAEYLRDELGYTLYGQVFFVQTKLQSKSTVFRLVRNNQRIYTPHQIEMDSARHFGYKDEGTVAINDLVTSSGNMPVYRIRTPGGIYLYTTSRVERDMAVLFYGCTPEGIPFYGLRYSNTPVLRASDAYTGFRIFASSKSEYNSAVTQYSYRGDGIGWYSYDN